MPQLQTSSPETEIVFNFLVIELISLKKFLILSTSKSLKDFKSISWKIKSAETIPFRVSFHWFGAFWSEETENSENEINFYVDDVGCRHDGFIWRRFELHRRWRECHDCRTSVHGGNLQFRPSHLRWIDSLGQQRVDGKKIFRNQSAVNKICFQAAHCILTGLPGSVSITVGSSRRLGQGGVTHRAFRVTLHPQYIYTEDPFFMQNDVAVIRTIGQIQFGPLVQPIALGSSIVPPFAQVVHTGWGLLGDVKRPKSAYQSPDDFLSSPSFVTVLTRCSAWIWWPSRTSLVPSWSREVERLDSSLLKKSAWLPRTMLVHVAATPAVQLFGRMLSWESLHGLFALAVRIQLFSSELPATSNGSASSFKKSLNSWNAARPRLSLFFLENSIKRTRKWVHTSETSNGIAKKGGCGEQQIKSPSVTPELIRWHFRWMAWNWFTAPQTHNFAPCH